MQIWSCPVRLKVFLYFLLVLKMKFTVLKMFSKIFIVWCHVQSPTTFFPLYLHGVVRVNTFSSLNNVLFLVPESLFLLFFYMTTPSDSYFSWITALFRFQDLTNSLHLPWKSSLMLLPFPNSGQDLLPDDFIVPFSSLYHILCIYPYLI
jgi:hypothetical protein